MKVNTSSGNWLILLLALLFCHGTVAAQSSDPPRATLQGWENQQRLYIMDRTNNFGGFYYDRGLFRFTTPEMDLEYYIDLFTYRHSYFEDYDWIHAENGFRSFMGSLNTPVFALRSELKNTIDAGSNGTLTIHAWQQEDLQAKRGLITVDYHYSLSERHRLGIMHTLGQRKTDLDATLSYRYGTRQTGLITTELTILDWANNFVSDLSESRQSEFEIRHIYSQKPYLGTLRLESPQMGPFRGEAVAAFQNRSEAEVSRRDFPDENYILQEWVNYQAALFEGHFRGLTTGIIWQRTFARMERAPAPGSDYELDYGNRQIQNRGGAYLHYRWRSFGIEQWFFIERNRDQQFDENPEAYIEQDPRARNLNRYPFNFEEIRRFNKTRLFFAPRTRNYALFLEHNGDWRRPHFDTGSTTVTAVNYRSYYPNHIVGRNERLTLGYSYTFSKTAMLTIGVSLDLDGDLYHGWDLRRENHSRAYFDGGFGRFMVRW